VDTPKGDLDASSGQLTPPNVGLPGVIAGDDNTVVQNSFLYPYGTQEQYPDMVDSDNTVLQNSAHYYMECSNKGICDRGAGTCTCLEGYGGSACQRALCPTLGTTVCSGHGTCETIRRLAAMDNYNVYNLWDQDMTMGCSCDGGYTGPDCSQRICKFGADPLYYDDTANVRVANFTYEIFTTNNLQTLYGNYSLIFIDHTGEDWETVPIDIFANCDAVTSALEGLPNNVIPSNSVRCYQDYGSGQGAQMYGTAVGSDPVVQTTTVAGLATYGVFVGGSTLATVFPKFTLAFTGNPGKIPQLKINKYLDGSRATLFSYPEAVSTVNWHIYSNGFAGEDVDYVPDRCDGVLVTLSHASATTYYHQLGGLTVQSAKALKRCLGSADNITSNNVDTYNWDYGTVANPHLVKLIDATQDYNPADAGTSTNDDDAVNKDHSLDKHPKTTLCPSTKSYVDYAILQTTAETTASRFDYGWCSNRNPAGFFAVLYFDGTIFRIFTRAADDYSATTLFHIFTTTGTLQLTNTHFGAHVYNDNNVRAFDTAATIATKLYSNTITTTSDLTVYMMGDLSCENFVAIRAAWFAVSASPIVAGQFLDCLNKGDLVMLFNTQMTTIASSGYFLPETDTLHVNPIYPNIYTVEKISIEPRGAGIIADPYLGLGLWGGPSYVAEMLRTQIVLDYGVNAGFTSKATGSVYKFYPPSNAEQGYQYVAECSNRGICDTATGLCACMHGYTSDNCGLQSALAA